jgi:NAD(P)-dependent dehydrogenase (short-subunit alcohol dehydrogenase family)
VTKQLSGQTVLVIEGTSGIELESARQARSEGAELILTGRDADRVHAAGLELGARIAAFDPLEFDRLERFFAGLPAPIDHLLLAGGRPCDASLARLDLNSARRAAERDLWLPLRIAQLSIDTIRPGGSLLLIGGSGREPPSAGPVVSAISAALPALTRSLALQLAPVRVNLIAPGGVGPADAAGLAIHLMTNTGITGSTFHIDGGQPKGGLGP